MKILSRTEEMILLAVFSLKEKAYGLSIRQHLHDLSGKQFSIGAIYVPLERLQERGLLTSREAPPTPERGGRSKRYYKLSMHGLKALEEIRALNDALWKDYPAHTGSIPYSLPISLPS